jgi:metal iron transporter
MNETSHTDEPYDEELEGFNQSPAFLSADLTTRQDLNGISNKRVLRGSGLDPYAGDDVGLRDGTQVQADPDSDSKGVVAGPGQVGVTITSLPKREDAEPSRFVPLPESSASSNPNREAGDGEDGSLTWGRRLSDGFMKFCSFIGPGFMIAVAYSMPP